MEVVLASVLLTAWGDEVTQRRMIVGQFAMNVVSMMEDTLEGVMQEREGRPLH